MMKELPIVYITDRTYAMPMTVSITSLIYNKAEDSRLHIYVIAVDLEDEDKQKISELQTSKCRISIIDVDQKKEYMQLEMENFHVSPTALYKFMLPRLFDQLDEVLYLDCDILILRDLVEIFEYDISACYAGVVKDYKATTYSPSQLKKLNLNNKHRFYFNSGMMYLNLKRMRENDIPSKLMDYRLNGINYFMDQDALNVIFEDEVIYIPFKYNLMYRIFEMVEIQKCYQFYGLDIRKSASDILDEAVILHLTGKEKPWIHYIPILSDIFIFYYQKSPYKKATLEILDNDPVETESMGTFPVGEAIPIVYICDNKTVSYMAVSLTSLILNKKQNTKYDIYVFCSGITKGNMNLLRLYQKIGTGCKISIFEVDEYDYENEYDYMDNAIAVSSLIKYSLPDRLSQLNKVIYLGNNTVVLKDLADLYNWDISGKYLGAVKDYRSELSNPSFNKRLFLNHEYYFGTGVLLLNLGVMREKRFSNELLYYKKYGLNYYGEQDAYNVCAKENVVYLPIYYNYMTRLGEGISKDILSDYYEIKKYASYEELVSRVFIINFTSTNRPWNEKISLETELFFYYLWRTPFYEKLDVRENMKNIKTLFGRSVMDKNALEGLKKENYKMMSFYIKEHLCPIKNRSLEDFNEIIDNYEVTHEEYKTNMGLYKLSDRNRKVIVSMTTIPQRINAAMKVIEKLLDQSMQPDRIILNLGEELFEGIELPTKMKEFEHIGVEVFYCKDLSCHTKYYYAMQKYPEDLIITVDDDIEYSNTLIEDLYKSYLKYPTAISAMRTHCMTFDIRNGAIAPYRKWHRESSEYICIPSLKLVATGVGGVLYPPHCMDARLLDSQLFMNLAPKADDLWLKMMQVLVGTPVVLAKRQSPLQFIDETQEMGLCYENVQGGGNDLQLASLLDCLGRETICEIIMQHERIPIMFYNGDIDTRVELQKQTQKIANKLFLKEEEVQRLGNELSKYQYCLDETRKSKSYRWGRCLTYLPRLVRHMIFHRDM